MKKTMPNNTIPLWNETVADLVASNGSRSDERGEFSLNGIVNWAINNTEGGSDGYGDVGGGGDGSGNFWWEEEGASGDTTIVKFGPDLGLLQAIGVYTQFLVFAAALVLVVAVVCKCVAGKVRLSLNRRSGPEIAFQFGASNDVIEQVVVAGYDHRRRGEDGDRTRDPNRLTL